jgi:hypothetical protein
MMISKTNRHFVAPLFVALSIFCLLRSESLQLLSRYVHFDNPSLIIWDSKSGLLEHDVLLTAQNDPIVISADRWQTVSAAYVLSTEEVPVPLALRNRNDWSKFTCKVIYYGSEGGSPGPILAALIGWPEKHLYWLYEERGW